MTPLGIACVETKYIAQLLAACEAALAALEHGVPYECWATGPNTGDVIEDLIVCPGCRAIKAINAAIAKAKEEYDFYID